MRVFRSNPLIKNGLAVLFVLFLLSLNGAVLADPPDSELIELLPDLEGWELKDSPLTFQPQNLYEHIDGAAEIYLSYDFKELVASEYTQKEGGISVSVEIYDMGREKNSFGIYSAETYPESEFIPVGIEGYIEKGSLNFLVGEYYVKLLCFDCGEQGNDYLKFFAEKIVQKVSQKGQFPPDLNHFPQEGLVDHTQKFVLENFMGYQFFHNGYKAHYKKGKLGFDCFLIHAQDKKEAQSMLEQYLDKKSEASPQKISSGYHLKDPYYQHVYIARVKEYLCGVMKIQDGHEKTGIRYLNLLIQNLKNQ
ncbi:hypothetical protein KGY73_03855 [bacterium]|nr:hypothetical protein [bacterium]